MVSSVQIVHGLHGQHNKRVAPCLLLLATFSGVCDVASNLRTAYNDSIVNPRIEEVDTWRPVLNASRLILNSAVVGLVFAACAFESVIFSICLLMVLLPSK